MLFFVCCAVAFVLGLIGIIICKCIDEFSSGWAPEWLSTLSACLLVVGLVVSIVIGLIVLDTQINKDLDYIETVEDRAALIASLDYISDKDKNAVMLVDVFSDIVDFNSRLRWMKKYRDNPWLNLFVNDLIADNIDYISFDGGLYG